MEKKILYTGTGITAGLIILLVVMLVNLVSADYNIGELSCSTGDV